LQGELSVLQICGPNVSVGYNNLQLQSSRVFLYDDQTNNGRSHRYHTDDKIDVEWTGNFVFCGRVDDQVKISGQRVELGAVESAVLSCPGVKQCAILVVENASGNKSLAAFVVVAEDATLDVGSIREHVARNAARHEVPHQIMLVEAIPLTTAGKADRTALKKLMVGADATSDAVAAVSEVGAVTSAPSALSSAAEAVARAMSQVLSRSVSASTDESFWELGGTSLMAMTLDGVLQATTGAPPIGIAKIMQDGSVAGIARLISGLLHRQQPETSVEKQACVWPNKKGTTTTTTTTKTSPLFFPHNRFSDIALKRKDLRTETR